MKKIGKIKGLPTMKGLGKGWKGDPVRHGLARRGIPTGRKQKPSKAEIDIINSPFSKLLGWKDDEKLTKAGKEVVKVSDNIKLKKKIRKLISLSDDVTRSDLQGMTQVIGMELTKDIGLRNEIDNRILSIIDDAEFLPTKEVNSRIEVLEKDLNKVL